MSEFLKKLLTIITYKHEKIRLEEVLVEFSWSHFFAFEKFQYNFFVIVSHDITGLQNFSLFFCLPIIIQNYDVYFPPVSQFLHWHNTWTALL